MNLRFRIRHELFVKRWNMGNSGWVKLKTLYVLVPGYSEKEVEMMVRVMSHNQLDQVEWNRSKCFPKYRHKQSINSGIVNEEEWRAKLRDWLRRVGVRSE